MKNRGLDRGNKLWEGHRMMLPEHRNVLLQRKDVQRRVPRPLLDDQQLLLISDMLTQAIQDHLEVNVKYWDNGKINEHIGYVKKVNQYEGWLNIINKGDSVKIRMKNITDVSLR